MVTTLILYNFIKNWFTLSYFITYLYFITTVKQIKSIGVILLLRFMNITQVAMIMGTTEKITQTAKRSTIAIRMAINVIIVNNTETIMTLTKTEISTSRNGLSILDKMNYHKNSIVKSKLIWKKREEKSIWKTSAAFFHVAVAVIVGAKNFPKKKN